MPPPLPPQTPKHPLWDGVSATLSNLSVAHISDMKRCRDSPIMTLCFWGLADLFLTPATSCFDPLDSMVLPTVRLGNLLFQ